jgi:hypothetical protein
MIEEVAEGSFSLSEEELSTTVSKLWLSLASIYWRLRESWGLHEGHHGHHQGNGTADGSEADGLHGVVWDTVDGLGDWEAIDQRRIADPAYLIKKEDDM